MDVVCRVLSDSSEEAQLSPGAASTMASEGLKKRTRKVFVTQLCPALSNPRDCSPRGSSVRGILQARILEWVAMPSSKGSSQPRD